MPRKPKGHRRSLRPQPLTFSRFARSVAQVASVQMVRSQTHKARTHRESFPNSTSNGFFNKSLIEKSNHSESSEDEGFDGVVQADFVFFDPKPDDFHGVKILLQTYLDDAQWDLSGFVDLILGQTIVGTIVKTEGDEDDSPFSVVTALSLGRYKDHKCIMELKEYLLKVCREKDVINDLRLLLGEQADDVGLLVSQRVVNLPPQLLPPMYDALFDEVSWATEDELTKELQDSFRFKFYLLVCKIYKQLKNVSRKKKLGSRSDEEMIYIKPEDEIFHQLSSWSFTFPMRAQRVETQELKNYHLTGLMMVVDAEKISTFQHQLQSLIDES
ncbi:protein BCCIP homolog isoform X2 [Mangifera indica]|uniref:protein BCCIP homolog isoform X2 n=1 Tax=Mangifera indica TaxID=29780 RepID=UPI001CF9D355|nr:protein BCCIP homolog isoform X2 [Mangifera indica]